MTLGIIFFTLLLALIFYNSKNLLLILILLEFLTFSVIYLFSEYASLSLLSEDGLLICLFSAFVMEGVVALAALILLVSQSGSDYLSAKNFLNI